MTGQWEKIVVYPIITQSVILRMEGQFWQAKGRDKTQTPIPRYVKNLHSDHGRDIEYCG